MFLAAIQRRNPTPRSYHYPRSRKFRIVGTDGKSSWSSVPNRFILGKKRDSMSCTITWEPRGWFAQLPKFDVPSAKSATIAIGIIGKDGVFSQWLMGRCGVGRRERDGIRRVLYLAPSTDNSLCERRSATFSMTSEPCADGLSQRHFGRFFWSPDRHSGGLSGLHRTP